MLMRLYRAFRLVDNLNDSDREQKYKYEEKKDIRFSRRRYFCEIGKDCLDSKKRKNERSTNSNSGN